jgi:hypothetical protein
VAESGRPTLRIELRGNQSVGIVGDKQVNIDHISASGLKTYEQCRLKFFIERILKVPEGPVHELTKMGKAVHGMLEKSVKSYKMGEGEKEISMRDPMFWKSDMMTEHCVPNSLSPLVDELIGNANDWGYFRNVTKTFGCEIQIEFTLPNGIKVLGYIDRMDLMLPNADILDIKTQKSEFTTEELNHNWQAKIYNIGARKVLPELTGTAKVSFWVLRHRVQRISLTAQDAERDFIELTEKVDEILACPDNPEGKPSGLCPWCPNYANCPSRDMGAKQRMKRVK